MKKKILDQLGDVLRLKHYSYKAEKGYIYWINKYILYHNKRRPAEMSNHENSEFLTHLAVKMNAAASPQNQALNAIVFFYKNVLEIKPGQYEIPWT